MVTEAIVKCCAQFLELHPFLLLGRNGPHISAPVSRRRAVGEIDLSDG